jgi:signal transduction histidine kinase
MKSPNFENCQIALDYNSGDTIDCADEISDWIGISKSKIINKNFHSLITKLLPQWGDVLKKKTHQRKLNQFFPIESNSLGVFLSIVPYKERELSIISISPALAPHDSLKNAFLGDIMKNPRAIANTLIRLQKAENRLDDYVKNFPGIFFTQRVDMTFSYLSQGIRNLFPSEYPKFSRNGNLFLEKIVEKDREYFQSELRQNSNRKVTFSLKYRLKLIPTNQLLYILDIRTPVITPGGKLLGYDGVLVDITRQSIAEHRVSNSVWREGLTTLTNGLVHDFSNLMSGIFSISELYYSMMEKDDPMSNGMGQIKKSAMQAQQLVRRIIDLHKEKPACRMVHDLRLLLKDQMDLLEIIIPRGAKIKTEFGNEPLPALIEETGFRQVILNLAINSRDAIDRNGKISISIKRVETGDTIMSGTQANPEKAKCTGAEISISDNGMGIDGKVTDKVFDAFFTTKESTGGSGFGLYNSKLFIEDHNGKIAFCSELGKGTTFYLFLPLVDTEESVQRKKKRAKKATREFVKIRRSNPAK